MESIPVTHIALTDLITAITIIMGFGITVFMFRLGREANTEQREKWVALSDYLIFASIALAVASLLLLFVVPVITSWKSAVAIAATVAAILLQAGFIPAILAHYRIAFGKHRTDARSWAEPWEIAWFVLTLVVAAVAFVSTLCQRLHEASFLKA